MSRNEHDPRRSGRRGRCPHRPKGSPYESGRFATLPGEASRCGGLRADRVVRPYKGFYKIHPPCIRGLAAANIS